MAELTKEVKEPKKHTGLAWLFGIIFFFSIASTLSLFCNWRITDETIAKKTIAVVLSTVFNNETFNNSEFALIKKMVGTDGTIKPFAGLDLLLKQSEIEGLSPEQIKELSFEKMAEELYKGDTQALAQIKEMNTQVSQGTDLIKTIGSAEAHQKAWERLRISAIVSVVALALFVLFSFRFGRLRNPGIVLALVSFLGMVISWLGTTFAPNLTDVPTTGGLQDVIWPVIGQIIPIYARPIFEVYGVAFLVGIILMILAGVGKIIYNIVKKSSKKTPEAPPVPVAEPAPVKEAPKAE